MRLDPDEIEILKESLKDLDNEAKIYLFGSRVNDKLKGGDIHLLVISKKLNRRSIRALKHKFFENFGEQRLDIILDNGEMKDPFVRKIFQGAVTL